MKCNGCDKCDGTGRFCHVAMLSPDDRALAAHALRAEANRRINRIQRGDPDDLRQTFVDLAVRCDDVATKIERSPESVNDDDALAAGIFVALVSVAQQYVKALMVDGTLHDSAVDCLLIGLRENLEDHAAADHHP